jgi:RNA polymerase sigma-70 factor (ECF subfamily)
MDRKTWLAEQFEANRPRLRAIALRMVGSEADDAVQEAWLKLNRSATPDVDNPVGWLTTAVARVCLDMLRSRKSRREQPMDDSVREPIASSSDPEDDVLLADSIDGAVLVLLKRLAPAERVAFVLHDMFDVPFEQIAQILRRSPVAARQLASRARRRIQGAPVLADDDVDRQREIVDAFLAASRSGDLNAILALLAPDVIFQADSAAEPVVGQREIHGAGPVAEAFKGRAQATRPALVDGTVGLAVIIRGEILVVMALAIANGKINAVDVIGEPEHLRQLDVDILGPQLGAWAENSAGSATIS